MTIEPFSLVREKMDVYVNLRIEKHGDDNVNGYDIKLSGSFANHAILPKLDVELLPALYTDDKQRELDEFKKKLRFPRAMGKALPWDLDIPRVVLTLHDEQDDKHSLTVSDCAAHKFAFLPKELGIVELAFTVKTKDLTEEQVMKLLRANGQELKVSMECREADADLDNFEQVDLLSQQNMSPARAEAERQFAAGIPDQAEEIAQTLAAAPPPEEPAPTEAPAAEPATKPRRRAKAVAGIE